MNGKNTGSRLKSAALSILAGAILLPAQSVKDSGGLHLAVPGKPWALQIDVQGFEVKTKETKPDSRQYMLAKNARTGLTLSVTLERVQGTASLAGCRETLGSRNQSNQALHPADVKEWQSSDMAILEFVLVEYQEVRVQQKNVFGCLPREDIYADIHISKTQYKRADQPLFDSALQAVHFVDQAAGLGSQSNSMAYLQEGRKYFLAHQFDKAIGPYQKALDLEKNDRKLETNLWRALVDNLGMAYGITGNLKSAEEVFQYGISKDSTYPMFYYNLACTYAEKNDLDHTIQYLKTAFEYKQNLIAGEQMPDPAKDDSFQRFLQVDKFRKLIASF